MNKKDFMELLENRDPESDANLMAKAREIRHRHYGNKIYLRGLVEFTSYCKNDCLYCGLRRSNLCTERYRLTKEEILSCCDNGYRLGLRTFVLQGGEDAYFTIKRMTEIIDAIKTKYPDCALTLSIGEQHRKTYQAFFDAGADRYLLRHETASESLYQKLHPGELSFQNRIRCLYDLKEIGFETGCGFLVGAPFQTLEDLAEEFCFITEFQPQMIGIGPFLPHQDTPFKNESAGSLELTLFMMAMTRVLLPNVRMPSTTALATLDPKGRELGILAGGNVLMPNLSPMEVRNKYLLYDNKANTGQEAAEGIAILKEKMEQIGYAVTGEK